MNDNPINFNQDSIIKLTPLTDLSKIKELVYGMLLPNETIMLAFKTLRDQLVFTDKRIITINVRGVTGMKKLYVSMPYKNIQYFGLQTPGFAEILHDAELTLYFNNGFHTHFEFSGNVCLEPLLQTISKYTLS